MQEIEEINEITTPICSTPKAEYIKKIKDNENQVCFKHEIKISRTSFLDSTTKNNCDMHLDRQLAVDARFSEEKVNKDSGFENERIFNDLCMLNEKSKNSGDRDGHLNTKQKKREDVVNKTILRAIRRFYLKLFKSENLKLVRKRFRNVKSYEFYEAIRKLIKKHKILQTNSDSNIINRLTFIPPSGIKNCGYENKDSKSLTIKKRK